jgi:hypothetical protein
MSAYGMDRGLTWVIRSRHRTKTSVLVDAEPLRGLMDFAASERTKLASTTNAKCRRPSAVVNMDPLLIVPCDGLNIS